MQTSWRKSIDTFIIYKERLQFEKEKNKIFASLAQNAPKNPAN